MINKLLKITSAVMIILTFFKGAVFFYTLFYVILV